MKQKPETFQSPVSQTVKKASQSSLRMQRIKSKTIFGRGAPQGGFSCPCGAIHLLYVDENTFQAASVEFVRQRRTNYARSRLQKLAESPEGVFRQAQKPETFQSPVSLI